MRGGEIKERNNKKIYCKNGLEIVNTELQKANLHFPTHDCHPPTTISQISATINK